MKASSEYSAVGNCNGRRRHGGADGRREESSERKQIRSAYFSSLHFSLSAAQVPFFTPPLLLDYEIYDFPMSLYRLAHPGGPLKTNKAAALAKFLERKLQDPNGLSSIDPDLIELAVKNARDTVISSEYLQKKTKILLIILYMSQSCDFGMGMKTGFSLSERLIAL